LSVEEGNSSSARIGSRPIPRSWLTIGTVSGSIRARGKRVRSPSCDEPSLEDCTLEDGDLEFLLESIVGDDPNAEARLKFERTLQEWDYVENADWTEGTRRNTFERRYVIYQRLRISSDLRARADYLIPVFQLESQSLLSSIRSRTKDLIAGDIQKRQDREVQW